MDIENIRKLIEDILNHLLYIDDTLNTELKTTLDNIITTINNNPDKITLLKRLEQYRSNNNAYAFDRILSIIINKLTLKLEEKYQLLNQDIPYFQTLSLWNKLNTQNKLAFLDSKNFLSILDLKRINYTLNNKKDSLEKIIIPIIKKIPDNSLILNDIPENLYLKKELIPKIKDNIITEYIHKYYYLGSDLKKLISSTIIRYAKDYSITLYNLDKETLTKEVNKHPFILQKLNPNLTIKLLDKNYLASLLNYNYNKTLNNTIKELNILTNNNNKYLTKEYLEKANNNSIYLYSPDLKLLNLFKSNYSYLLKLHYDTLVYLVNNKYTEEEKVNLLRNQNFINNLPDNYLESILNKMKFPNVFNMLQNITILNKVKYLNINLQEYDKIFITGYLDSPALVNISSNDMLNKMFNLISPLEIKKYLEYPYIYTKLKSYDIINILINNKLNIYTDTPKLPKVLRLEELKYYINKIIKYDTIRYDILFNPYTLDILNIKINLKDEDKDTIKYLYDLILIRGNTTLECNTNDLESFKSIIISYYIFGLTKTKELYDNGNSKITIEEVNNIKKSYINYFIKIFNKQIDIDKIMNIIINKNFKNKDLINLINEMNNTNYSNILNTKEVLKNYLEYEKISTKESKESLRAFLINYNNYLEEYQITNYSNRFDKIKYQNYHLKSNLYNTYQEKYTKDFIKLKKVFILYNYLKGDLTHSSWFLKDKSSLENVLNDYLSRYSYKLDITLDKIIKPFLDEINISKIISNLGFAKPAYYEIIKYERNEKIKLTKINNKLKGILKEYKSPDRIIILNYLAYGINPTLILDKKILLVLNEYKKTIANFNGKVNVNKIKEELDYISIINLTNDSYLKEYNRVYLDILNIINYFKGIANKYIKTDYIKSEFKDEYLEGLKNYILPLNTLDENIVLKSHKMYLDGFKKVFKDIKLDKEFKIREDIKERLSYIIPYIIDNYFDDITYNYSKLFQDNLDTYTITSWDTIIAFLGQKN